MKRRILYILYHAAALALLYVPFGRAADTAETNPAERGAESHSPPPGAVTALPTNRTNVSVIKTTPHSKSYFVPDGQTNALGELSGRTIEVVETGMNYWNGSNYVSSEAIFEPNKQGTVFIANRVNHKTRISADLNSRDAVMVTMPDGSVISSTPVAMGLYSAKDGRSVIVASIAENTNASGTLTASNEVTFPDAFLSETGQVRASVVFKIENGTFSQDVVVHRLDPADFGFDEEDAVRIKIYTEFYRMPQPDLIKHPLRIEADQSRRQQLVDPDLQDTTIGFGEFVLGVGKAYALSNRGTNANSASAPVGKELVRHEGRVFLVESLEYSQVRKALVALNTSGSDKASRTASVSPSSGKKPNSKDLASAKQGSSKLPNIPAASTANRTLSMDANNKRVLASVQSSARDGVWIDYVASIASGVYSTTVFKADQTVFVQGATYYNGPLTIEGGCVIKYPNSTGANATTAFIQINSALALNTSMWRPAVFCAGDENNLGDQLNTTIWTYYSGNTLGKYYANPALRLGAPLTLSNCRFSYAKTAVSYESPTADLLTVSHSWFANCMEGIRVTLTGSAATSGTTLTVNNALFAGVTQPLTHYNMTYAPLNLNQCTFEGANPMANIQAAGEPLLAVTAVNCVFANSSLAGSPFVSLSGHHNGFYNTTRFGTSQYSTSVTPFTTAAAGSHYLKQDSNFRGVASTGINSGLLTELRKRTVSAPYVYAQQVLATVDTRLWPKVEREVGPLLSLGYHPAPMDYAFAGVNTTGPIKISIEPGTVIGCFATNTLLYGLGLDAGATLSGIGLATNFVRFVECASIQEGSTPRPTTFMVGESGTAGAMNFRFVDINSLAQGAPLFSAIHTVPNFKDCQLHGGTIGVTGSSHTFTNCVFERVATTFTPTSGGTPVLRNNLFFGGTLVFQPQTGSAIARENFFDRTTITSGLTGLDADYNGYINSFNRILPSASPSNDQVITDSDYKAGPLGPYYYPTTGGKLSLMIDHGSALASAVGLYHYTTSTNTVSGAQIREANTTVDIGFHYVALGSNGQPFDSNGDGIPDYIQDANGNGITDDTETSYANPVITLSGNSPSYQEGQSAQIIDPGATVSASVANFNGGRLRIEVSANGEAEDVLGINNQSPISISGNVISYSGTQIAHFDGGSGLTPLVIDLTSSSASLAAVQAIVQNITYKSDSDRPSTLARGVKFLLMDGHGGTSLPVTKTVAVSMVNDKPIITLSGNAPVYPPYAPPIIVDPQATFFDRDSSTLNGGNLTVTITANSDSNDRLEILNNGPGTGQIGVFIDTVPATWVTNVTYGGVIVGTVAPGGQGPLALRINFNPNSSPPAADALVRSITFRNVAHYPASVGATTRTIRFEASDGSLSADIKNKTLTVGCAANPLDIAVVIDRSSSMNTLDQQNKSRLHYAKVAASNFVYNVGQANHNDRVAVASFGKDATIDKILSTDYSGAEYTICNISATGPNSEGTAIGLGVEKGQLALTSITSPRVIILLTDGVENMNSDPVAKATAAKQAGIRVITIGVAVGDTGTAHDNLVEMASPNPARPTGKDYYSALNATELQGIYEQIANSLCVGGNQPPSVVAGSSQCGSIPDTGGTTTVTLSGQVNDAPGTVLRTSWSLIFKPSGATATFGTPAQTVTASTTPITITSTATVDTPGAYVFRLTANDGSLSSNADVQVFVFTIDSQSTDPLPMVDAGLPQWTIVGLPVQLNGMAKDWPGCTTPPVKWTQVSAPSGATVSFSSDTSLSPIATGFTVPGQYVLMLSAADNADPPVCGTNPRAACDTVTITVCNQTETPVDVALVADCSTSMGANISQERDGANTFADLANMSIHQVALLEFGFDGYLYQPLTHDKQLLKSAISLIDAPDTATDVRPGIRLAQAELLGPRHNPAAFPIMILMGDGAWGPVPGIRPDLNAAKMAGIRIITIGIGVVDNPTDPDDDADRLRQMASCDSDCHLVSSPDQLREVYASIAESFCLNPNRRPVVFAGPDQTTDLTKPVKLAASVYDENPSTVTYLWENTTPGAGTVTFTPSANVLSPKASFSAPGDYTLKLTATDSQGLTDSSTVTLHHGKNSDPIAQTDTFVISPNVDGEPIKSTLLDVLKNDYDPDGDPVVVTGASCNPNDGQVEVVYSGSRIRYTPRLGLGGVKELVGYQISDGKGGLTSAQAEIWILPINHPPKANDDVFKLANGTMAPRFLNVLRNDTDPDPLARYFGWQWYYLRVVSFTPIPSSQGTLTTQEDALGHLKIYYTPPSINFVGTATFSYTIADCFGAQSTANVTVNVVTAPVNQAPVVSAGPAQSVASAYPSPSTVLLQGIVTDDGLPIDGDLTAVWSVLSTPPAGSVAWPGGGGTGAGIAVFANLLGDGDYTLRLTVTDAGNLSSFADTTVHVVADDLIALINSPAENGVVEDGVLSVRGAAEDHATGGNFSYTISIYAIDKTSQQPEISPKLTQTFTTQVLRTEPPAELARFDLSTLENDHYVARLTVSHDTTGPTKIAPDVHFTLNSRLKLGRFTFSEQDAVIPFGGISLTVNRSYDSFTLSRQGDFGYGWTYALGEMDAAINEIRQNVTDDEGATVSVRTGGGRDVTLTLPNGERTTFYFTLRNGIGYQYAEWIAPPGVYATLEPIGDNRLSVIGVVSWQAGDYHTPYDNFDFQGFILTTTTDGTTYRLDAKPLDEHWFGAGDFSDGVYVKAYGKLKLTSITRPDLEKVIFSDDRIDHFDATSPNTPIGTVFLRHDNATYPNLITSVFDPNTASGIDPVVKYVYTTGGDLQEVQRLIVDRNSGGPTYASTTYTYGEGTPPAPPHYLTGIKDSRNVQAAITEYDSNGRVHKLKDPKGRETTFDYTVDASSGEVGNQLTTDYLGHTIQQFFDSHGNVVRTRDAYLHDSTRQFDENGNVTYEVDAAGGNVASTYDLHGNATSQDQYVYWPYDGVSRHILTTNYYNNFGQLTGTGDPNTVGANPDALSTINVYDDQGRILFTTNALNQVTMYSYFQSGNNVGRLDTVTDPGQNKTSYQYDPRGNVTSVTLKNAANQVLSTTTSTYDANNNQLTSTTARTLPNGSTEAVSTASRYDPRNRVIETTDPRTYSSRTIYNSIGKVSASIDKRNQQTSYFYDSTGDLVRTVYPDGSFFDQIVTDSTTIITGENCKVVIIEDPHFASETNVKGIRNVYDRLDRIVRTERLENINITYTLNIDVATVTYVSCTPIAGSATLTEYDNAGRVKTATDARGNSTTYDYDEAGRRVAVKRVNDVGNEEATIFKYDLNGNMTNSYIYYWDNQNSLQIHGPEVTNVYDALNCQTDVLYPPVAGVHDSSNPNKRTTIYDELGRVIQEIDQAGIKTGFAYDGMGRLIWVTNAFNTTEQTLTGYGYDEAGNMISQTDAEGRTTRFEYDRLGHRLTRSLPGLQSEYFTYDEEGNMLSHTDFNGRRTSFEYDLRNRLKTKTADPYFNYSVSFTYKPFGSRDAVTDSSGRTTTYSYDNRNRLQRKVSPEGVLKYSYDENGNVLTAQTVKNDGVYNTSYGGFSVAYTWDKLNRLWTVTDQGAGGTTTYVYDELDRLAECDYPSGTGPVKHTYHYNEANWMDQVEVKQNTTSLGLFTYGFADASPLYTGYYPGRTGARTAVSGSLNNSSVGASYNYDLLYRLNKETLTGTPSGTISYDSQAGYSDTGGFDRVGNRRSRTASPNPLGGIASGSWTYTSNDRLLIDSYDNNGNTTVSAGYTYTYDFENHLKTRNSTPSLSFAYDHDGNRVSKTVSSTVTYFLVDEQNPTGYPQVVEELTAVGANPIVSKTYTYGLRVISQRSPSALQYYGHDGHGNVRLLLNANGIVNQAYTYDAFGTLVSSQSPSGNNYLYCGEQFDSDLGMYYLRARYYSPDKGRFLTFDAFAGFEKVPESLHKYTYCKNNTVNLADPTGKWGSAELYGYKSFVHQEAIDRALQSVSANDRQTLKDMTVLVDTWQKPAESYYHAMRDGLARQSAAEARQKANDWVRDQILKARKARRENNIPQAMQEFGKALHTLQDSTSPAHYGFQPWYGENDSRSNVAAHALKERYYPGDNSNLFKITKRALEYYLKDDDLPADFFNEFGPDGLPWLYIEDKIKSAPGRGGSQTQSYEEIIGSF
jgi:RHS repeat-associated protein